jgi:hypothetical protein
MKPKLLITASAAISLIILSIGYIQAGKNKEAVIPPKAEPNSDLNKCPATLEPAKLYTVSVDVDLTYKHCKTCGYGVFLPHDDGVIKCTHCGILDQQ